MINRVLKYCSSKLKGKVPSIDVGKYTELEKALVKEVSEVIEEMCTHMEKTEIKMATFKMIEVSHKINKYLQDSEFWTKPNAEAKRNELVIGFTIRVI